MTKKQSSQYRISDELWEKIEPLLPKRENTHPFGGGRPPRPDRDCMDAFVFVLRTGSQWNALNETTICPSSTAHDRFQQWADAGVFWRFWQEGIVEYDEFKGIDWEWLSGDGCQTKAPLGGEKTGRNPTDRGKLGTKRSVLTDGEGVPLGLAVAGANRHDKKLLAGTIHSVPVEYPMPQMSPNVCLDKGYDYDDIRQMLEQFGFTAHIRGRGEEAQAKKREAGQRARRWVSERTHSWMNRFRRVLIRWEKKPKNYCAMLHFVCGVIAFRAAGLFG